jgi:hypothetical protein
MSSRDATPSLNAENRRGDKAQEGIDSTVDEILLRSGTDFRKTRSPEGAADGSSNSLLVQRKLRGNAERESPSDELGRVFREGKTLKGRNPKSVSGMKQGCIGR